MARPKARIISRPFDPRHVAGVSIPGTNTPLHTTLHSSSSSSSHYDPDDSNVPVAKPPKRSLSIKHSLSRPSLRLKPSISISRLRSRSGSSSASPDAHKMPDPACLKALPPVRPGRADSGVAVEVPASLPDQRPLGFREILAVPSLEERLVLYKGMREYWAREDHGLAEWVGMAGGRVVS